MDNETRTQYANLYSADHGLRSVAYDDMIKATDQPVDWAYEIWDDVLANLQHKGNHQRSIAAQLFSNLAKSDPEKRMLHDFAALLAVTKDERFVTARHCLQSLWKVGAAGPQQLQMVVDGLSGRFQECIAEKNCTLIRYDIIVVLKQLYDEVKEEQVKTKALALIATEADEKYRKKYTTIWKAKRVTSST